MHGAQSFSQVKIQYEDMEGFLHSCKQLNIRLFKDASIPDYPPPEDHDDSAERYEMNNFQLMCKNCYKVSMTLTMRP